MKKNTKRFLLVLMMLLSLCFLCTACGGGAESVNSVEPQGDPNEDLGGDFSHYVSDSDDDSGDSYYSWNSELCQRNVSEFEGVWYYDEDPSASTYIVIDGYGNWSYYQRETGDAEGTEMDYGTFSYSTDECSVYYADSAMYDGLSIRVFEFDEGILDWGDEGTYYLEKDYRYEDESDRSDSWNSELYQRDVSEFEGVWYYDEDPSASTYIVIDGYGNWSYYQRETGDAEGTEMDYGTFSYSTDEYSVYYADSAMYDGLSIRVFEFDSDILVWGDEGAYYLEKDYWYEDESDRSDSWNSELYQRDVSEFEGVWYYDEDPSASTYIVIDGYGNWSYYQRETGDAEGTEMDYGTFSYSTDECSVYYADSAMYDGISFHVYEFDEGVLLWGDEGAYYRME